MNKKKRAVVKKSPGRVLARTTKEPEIPVFEIEKEKRLERISLGEMRILWELFNAGIVSLSGLVFWKEGTISVNVRNPLLPLISPRSRRRVGNRLK